LKINKKILIGSCFLISISMLFYTNYYTNNSHYIQEKPKSSGVWATLDLDDPPGLNETTHQTNSVINVQGRLYNLFDGFGKPGYTVIIYVDGTPYSSFTDITDGNGDFNIAFTVDPFLDVYTPHILEVIVDSPIPPGDVDYTSYYSITINTTSYFDVNTPSDAKLIGEFFDFDSDDYLRYLNGNGIPFSSINYFWYDGAVTVDSNTVSTDITGLIQPIPIPDIGTADLDLKLTFQSLPEIGYSEVLFTETKLFSNISCIWNLPSTIRALNTLTIAGQVVSKTDPTVVINDRLINIYYNGTLVSGVQTDSNGDFSVHYSLNNSTGLTFIAIRLQSSPAIVTRHFVTVQQQLTPSGPGDQIPPFLLFFTIFLPILGVVVGGLAFYGYRYYKKQDKLSKVVNLPLEDRITNLKILKETGRLEESLSYLFNAIYMDLINAKFGRTRNDNETIRDFAIISVKELSLTPARIYPFIQKIEEIIYAKPFQITDKEFYSTIDLFSPIYFELTGYNFVLKF